MHSPRVIFTVSFAALLFAAGCKGGKSYQVANPVLGPVPPRVAKAQPSDDEGTAKTSGKKSVRGQNSGIETASFNEDTTQPLSMTEVIAEVNGEPIFAHEVLDRYAPQMAKAKLQMKPEQIRRAQIELIKRDLPPLIDQTLMVDAIKVNLKSEQLKSIDDQMDKYFQGEIDRLMKATNTSSPTELETVLQANGTSLVTLRKNFGDRQLAGQYMRTKLGEEPAASREEMMAVYERDAETYAESEEIKWQQIDISYEDNGGVENAEKVAQELLTRIRSGEISFDEAAHKKSDSPLASSGGHSDWTKPGSLADEDLRDTLTSMQVNDISDLIATKKAFLIVMLTGHHEARVIPFNEVQKTIHDKIIKEKKDTIAKSVVKELREKAEIHTILDDEAAAAPKEKLLIQ